MLKCFLCDIREHLRLLKLAEIKYWGLSVVKQESSTKVLSRSTLAQLYQHFNTSFLLWTLLTSLFDVEMFSLWYQRTFDTSKVKDGVLVPFCSETRIKCFLDQLNQHFNYSFSFWLHDLMLKSPENTCKTFVLVENTFLRSRFCGNPQTVTWRMILCFTPNMCLLIVSGNVVELLELTEAKCCEVSCNWLQPNTVRVCAGQLLHNCNKVAGDLVLNAFEFLAPQTWCYSSCH